MAKVNPYTLRSLQLENALREEAERRNVAPSALSRAEVRAIARERGLYTSEGSLSRDLAAIRRERPGDFGGPRRGQRGPERDDLVTINNRTYIRRRLGDLTAADARRVVALGVLQADGSWEIRRARSGAGATAQMEDGQRLAALHNEAASWLDKRRLVGGGIKRPSPAPCIVCGESPSWEDPAICAECAAGLDAEYDEDEVGNRALYRLLREGLGLSREDAVRGVDVVRGRYRDDTDDLWVLVR